MYDAPLFNAAEARRVTDEAVERVGISADQKLKEAARRAIFAVARSVSEFTTDEVWKRLADSVDEDLLTSAEPRFMGAVMRGCQKTGWIEPTGRYQKSARVACHGRPLLVWRSMF